MLVDQLLHTNLVKIFTDLNILENVFYVGGMVRDHLLGRRSRDVDIVVEKITPDQLTKLNNVFKLVGKDFPVFTFEAESSDGMETIELAVARKERSTGVSYTDFEVEFGENITLSDDLARRDVTINAMAVPLNDLNTLIDNFNGLQDLSSGIIRHTTDAFAEDPLRVFRVARFAARYNFKVDPATIELMKTLVIATDTLSEERIFIELEKVFASAQKPSTFFRVLKECENLDMWFPAISNCVNLKHIHDDDVFEHTMQVIDNVRSFGASSDALFGALYHDVGKIFTDEQKLPVHFGHDVTGLQLVPFIAKRLRLPTKIKQVIEDSIQFHLKINLAAEMRPAKLLNMVSILTKHRTLEDVLCVVRADRMSKGEADVDPIVFERIRLAEIINKKQVPTSLQASFKGKKGAVIAKIVEQWRVKELKLALG